MQSTARFAAGSQGRLVARGRRPDRSPLGAAAVLTIGAAQPSATRRRSAGQRGTALYGGEHDGDIYALDPRRVGRGRPDLGETFDVDPMYLAQTARSSRSPAFRRRSPVGPADLTLDGRGRRWVGRPTLVTRPTVSIEWFDWSPDGSQIAFISRVDRQRGVVNVIGVRRHVGRPTFDIGQPAMFANLASARWAEIIVRGEQLSDWRSVAGALRRPPGRDGPPSDHRRRSRTTGSTTSRSLFAGWFERLVHALVVGRHPASLPARRRHRAGTRAPDALATPVSAGLPCSRPMAGWIASSRIYRDGGGRLPARRRAGRR